MYPYRPSHADSAIDRRGCFTAVLNDHLTTDHLLNRYAPNRQQSNLDSARLSVKRVAVAGTLQTQHHGRNASIDASINRKKNRRAGGFFPLFRVEYFFIFFNSRAYSFKPLQHSSLILTPLPTPHRSRRASSRHHRVPCVRGRRGVQRQGIAKGCYPGGGAR